MAPNGTSYRVASTRAHKIAIKRQAMSALGQKQTCAAQNSMSALHPIATAKAKIPKHGHVRFTPESGHVQCTSTCPLWAKSGHGAMALNMQPYCVGRCKPSAGGERP